jgi:hypothetical protein
MTYKDLLTHNEALEALRFALNYPEDVILNKFNIYEDIYIVDILDGGWYANFEVNGCYVRHCHKWQGQRSWRRKADQADYDKLFKGD